MIFGIAIFRVAAVDVSLDQPKFCVTFFHPRSHRETAA
jgi:hypothetical protein